MQGRRNNAPTKGLDYLLKKISKIHNTLVMQELLLAGVKKIDIYFFLDIKGSHCIFKIKRHHMLQLTALNVGIDFDVWRAKYRETPVYYFPSKDGDLYYGTDFEYCGFEIKSSDFQRFIDLGIEPTIHVW